MQRFEGNREGISEKRLERTLGFDEYWKRPERRWLAWPFKQCEVILSVVEVKPSSGPPPGRPLRALQVGSIVLGSLRESYRRALLQHSSPSCGRQRIHDAQKKSLGTRFCSPAPTLTISVKNPFELRLLKHSSPFDILGTVETV